MVASALIAAQAAGAQVGGMPFHVRTQPAAAIQLRSAAVGDFDGDGLPDVALTGISLQVQVLLSLGDGTFTDAGLTSSGAITTGVFVGEFNGDAVADLAVAQGAMIAVMLGDGAGGFASPISHAAGPGVASLATGEFNGDGRQDLVVGRSSGSTVTVLLGNGDGSFTFGAHYPTGLMPRTVAVADFDADGVQDFAAANEGASSVTILLGLGDGTFASGGTVTGGPNPRSIVAADWNGDGAPDLATANAGSITPSTVLVGQGDGTFVNGGTVGLSPGPLQLLVGDLNDDGRLDLVARSSSGRISVAPGHGDGTFAPVVVHRVGDGAPDLQSIALGDFDGDGHQDVVAVNGGSDRIAVLRGLGTGALAGNGPLANGDDASSVDFGDFDGDGRTDLAIAGAPFSSPGAVSIKWGDGAGSFTDAAAILPVGADPRALVTGDFDGDGFCDLATADTASDTVTVILSLGNRIFAPGSPHAVADDPRDIVAVDIDGDGDLDLATANHSATSLSILLGAGDGSFAGALAAAGGALPIALEAGLLDGDAIPDLVTVLQNSGSLRVLLGQGNGSFANGGTYPAGTAVSHVAIADVDGDGLRDLVTDNYGAASVGFLVGHGDGSFTDGGSIPIAPFPGPIAVTDVTGDGTLDLVVLESSSVVAVRAGNGSGFDAPQFFDVFGMPTAMAVGDLDGDGRPDIVAAGDEPWIPVLMNRSTGGVGAWVNLGAGLAGVQGIPVLAGTGVQLGGQPAALTLTKSKPSAFAVLFVGLSSQPTTFKGAWLVPIPLMMSISLATGPDGTLTLPFLWPAGMPSGLSLYYQCGIQDAAAVQGVALSSALRSITP